MIKKHKPLSHGFTLVELLIVIVVVGILASITTVAYSGLQKRAADTQRTAKIKNIVKQLEIFYNQHGAYPSHDEITPNGPTTLGVPIEALSPPENPRSGIIIGSRNTITNPGPNDFRFAYITHPNEDGSGLMCGGANRCRSFSISYILSDGTSKAVHNSGHRDYR